MTCTSCGAEDDLVERVHRMYVLPDADGGSPVERVLDDVEEWCFACRTHYPHRLVD